LTFHRTIAFVISIAISLATTCSVVRAGDSTRSTPRPQSLPFLSQYDSTRAIDQLRQRLDAIFGRSRGANVSVVVASLKRNVILYDRNGSMPLTPASTTKLFSTSSVFRMMGEQATLNTDVKIDGSIDANGTLNGDLYLVGHGDAMLSVNDLEELADKVHQLGIRRITGNVYGDGSFFDNVTQRAVYSGDGETVQGMPPVTALGVNNNTVAVLVQGASNGSTFVQTVPASDAFIIGRMAAAPMRAPAAKKTARVRGNATPKKMVPKKKKPPVKKRSRGHTDVHGGWGLDVQRYGDVPPEPASRQRGRRARRGGGRVSISSASLANGAQQFIVRGTPGAHRSFAKYFVMTDPVTAAAGTFRVRLRAGGINIDGTFGRKSAPATCSTITSFRRPFVDFASVVNKRSDNFYAEHCFKIVGGLCNDNANTAARAKRGLIDVLDSLHVPHDGCVLNDGSGLSRRNKVSALTEMRLLQAISKQRWADAFKQTLSIASVDGTLRRRMSGTPAAGNVRAKTGTLRNTSALAGYVTTLDGEPLVFSIISNGPNVGSYKATENLAAITLASFSYKGGAPTVDDHAAEKDTTDDVRDEHLIDEEHSIPK
jgi:D-alanyl-D-alanine carboxypeptidase/D-alanyl-D-alanine-endopeptidase (penicillin-binding protein 4)